MESKHTREEWTLTKICQDDEQQYRDVLANSATIARIYSTDPDGFEFLERDEANAALIAAAPAMLEALKRAEEVFTSLPKNIAIAANENDPLIANLIEVCMVEAEKVRAAIAQARKVQ